MEAGVTPATSGAPRFPWRRRKLGSERRRGEEEEGLGLGFFAPAARFKEKGRERRRPWGRHGSLCHYRPPPRWKVVRRRGKEEMGRAGVCWAELAQLGQESLSPYFFFLVLISFLKLFCFCILKTKQKGTS